MSFSRQKSEHNGAIVIFCTKIAFLPQCGEVLTNIRGGKYRNPSHSKFKGKNHIGAKNDLCLRCQNQSSSSSFTALLCSSPPQMLRSEQLKSHVNCTQKNFALQSDELLEKQKKKKCKKGKWSFRVLRRFQW